MVVHGSVVVWCAVVTMAVVSSSESSCPSHSWMLYLKYAVFLVEHFFSYNLTAVLHTCQSGFVLDGFAIHWLCAVILRNNFASVILRLQRMCIKGHLNPLKIEAVYCVSSVYTVTL